MKRQNYMQHLELLNALTIEIQKTTKDGGFNTTEMVTMQKAIYEVRDIIIDKVKRQIK